MLGKYSPFIWICFWSIRPIQLGCVGTVLWNNFYQDEIHAGGAATKLL